MKNNNSLTDKILKVNSNFNTGVFNYFHKRRMGIKRAFFLFVCALDIVLFMFSFILVLLGSVFVYVEGQRDFLFYIFALVILVSLFNSVFKEIENIKEVFKK